MSYDPYNFGYPYNYGFPPPSFLASSTSGYPLQANCPRTHTKNSVASQQATANEKISKIILAQPLSFTPEPKGDQKLVSSDLSNNLLTKEKKIRNPRKLRSSSSFSTETLGNSLKLKQNSDITPKHETLNPSKKLNMNCLINKKYLIPILDQNAIEKFFNDHQVIMPFDNHVLLKEGIIDEKCIDGVLRVTYVKGIGQGKAVKTFSDGAVLTMNLVNGVEEGEANVHCNEYDFFLNYKKGVEQGRAIKCFSNGARLTLTYIDGVLQGQAVHKYADGNTFTYINVDGIAQGIATLENSNGTRYTCLYKDGTPLHTTMMRVDQS